MPENIGMADYVALHAALVMALAAYRWDALVLSLLLPALVGPATGLSAQALGKLVVAFERHGVEF